MIKHIVCWNLKEKAHGLEKAALKAEARRQLEALPPLIGEIKAFQVGDNLSQRPVAMDLVLVSEFETLGALKIYMENPAHVAVAAWLKEAVSETRVVDYEF
jgi:hypothetical protein